MPTLNLDRFLQRLEAGRVAVREARTLLFNAQQEVWSTIQHLEVEDVIGLLPEGQRPRVVTLYRTSSSERGARLPVSLVLSADGEDAIVVNEAELFPTLTIVFDHLLEKEFPVGSDAFNRYGSLAIETIKKAARELGVKRILYVRVDNSSDYSDDNVQFVTTVEDARKRWPFLDVLDIEARQARRSF